MAVPAASTPRFSSRPPVALFFTVVLITLTAATPVTAQTTDALRGRIVEMGTSRPLAGAEIGLPDLRIWALAEMDGRFSIPGVPAGRHRIEISQLGYRTYEAVLTVPEERTPLTLELWPDPVVLEGLTVQTSRLKARLAAIPHTTRTVDRPALTGAHTPTEAIRRTGEMLVPCGAETSEHCLMRRGRPVAPVVYIDERPAFGLEELEAHPIETLQLIEVIGHRMIRAYTLRFMERLALGKEQLAAVVLN